MKVAGRFWAILKQVKVRINLQKNLPCNFEPRCPKNYDITITPILNELHKIQIPGFFCSNTRTTLFI